MDNDGEIYKLHKLINTVEDLLNSPNVEERKIYNWMSEVKSTLPRGYLGKLTRLVLIVEDSNYFEYPTLEYNVDDIKIVRSILIDHLYKLTARSHDDKIMYILRIISARENDSNFELGLAERICGDNELFPYKTGAELTNFFHDLGYAFTHNGQTRKYWVQDRLVQINAEELVDVIQHGLFNRKYYSPKFSGKTVIEYDLQSALEDFQKFLISATKPIEPLRLELIFDSNAISGLFFKPLVQTRDSQLNAILVESKDLYWQNKQNLALEKLWDGFERLKTLLSDDKKTGSTLLASRISNNIESDRIQKEMVELTDIGNSYQIRHHEVTKIPLSSNVEVTYLYFRMLAFVDYALESLRKKKYSE